MIVLGIETPRDETGVTNLRGHTLFQAYSCVGYDRPSLFESSRRCEP